MYTRSILSTTLKTERLPIHRLIRKLFIGVSEKFKRRALNKEISIYVNIRKLLQPAQNL